MNINFYIPLHFLSVCLAIRFRIPRRIFSTSARARMIKRSLIYGRIFFKFAVNILQVTSISMGYVLLIFTHCARVREHVCESAWLKHSLIFGRILFKFAGHILKITTSYMGYILRDILIMFTNREHARERTRASAPVINCSPNIYGRFLFKFAVNILQITKSSKGYVHVHAPRTRVRARVCERERG
jgi:hypothetical protein